MVFSNCTYICIAAICQLRLDFDNFDITDAATGICTDSFTAAGPTGRNPMDLCGTLTGMHGKYFSILQIIELQKMFNDYLSLQKE